MKKSIIAAPAIALMLLANSAKAYTAFPYVETNAPGLVASGALGYTVLGADGVTIITARTTAGIIDAGGGSYIIPAGYQVPNGTTYYTRWDRTDTGAVIGTAPTHTTDLVDSVLTQTTPTAQQLDATNALLGLGYTALLPPVITILGKRTLNRQNYNAQTHVLQLLYDDGTPYGSPLTLTIDANNNIIAK